MKLKRVWVVGIFFVLIGLGIGNLARAEECILNKSVFEGLQQTGDPQSYLQKIRQELSLRKELISSVLDCAIEEASALKTSVDASSAPELQRIALEISTLLGNSMEYYKFQRKKIPDLGLEGSRDFASDILVWRKGNYIPVAKTASNIILWSKNQALMRAAKSRLDQIGGAVTILKLIENDRIQNKWKEANISFDAARLENKSAVQSFENFAHPEETLASIKRSLEYLSKTYEVLVNLVDEISKLTSKIQQPYENSF